MPLTLIKGVHSFIYSLKLIFFSTTLKFLFNHAFNLFPEISSLNEILVVFWTVNYRQCYFFFWEFLTPTIRQRQLEEQQRVHIEIPYVYVIFISTSWILSDLQANDLPEGPKTILLLLTFLKRSDCLTVL